MESGEMLKNRPHTPCVESCSCLCVCVHQQAEDGGEETMPAAGVMASVLAAIVAPVAAAVIPSEAEPEVAPEEESPSSSESQKDKVGNSLPRNRPMFSR